MYMILYKALNCTVNWTINNIALTELLQQHDPALAEQISQNVTRQGLTNYTLNFLRVNTLHLEIYYLTNHVSEIS